MVHEGYFPSGGSMAKNFHAMYPIPATAGSMITPLKSSTIRAPPKHTQKWPCRSCAKKLKSVFPLERVRILGLIREEQWNELAFVGYVAADEAELDGRKLPINSFESDAFESVAACLHEGIPSKQGEQGQGPHAVDLGCAGPLADAPVRG